MLRALEHDGVDVRLGAAVSRVDATADGIRVEVTGAGAITAGQLLVAVGRRPLTNGLGLARAGVAVDDLGYIRTDDRLATTAAGVYAAGDVTGRLAFTHAADEMGRIAAVNALYRLARLRFHAASVPMVTFTDPEVARVGMTEAQAAGRGGRVAHLPLSAVDRAVTAGRTEGFIRLVTAPRGALGHAGGGRLVGATVVAPHAGEMIHELALAVRTGMFTGRLAQTVHAHPT